MTRTPSPPPAAADGTSSPPRREAPSGVDTKLSVYDSAGDLLASTDGSPAAQPLTNVDDSFLDLDLPSGATTTYYVLVGSHGNYDDQDNTTCSSRRCRPAGRAVKSASTAKPPCRLRELR